MQGAFCKPMPVIRNRYALKNECFGSGRVDVKLLAPKSDNEGTFTAEKPIHAETPLECTDDPNTSSGLTSLNTFQAENNICRQISVVCSTT